MEHQEGNELLLSRTWQTGGNMAFGEDTEPAKEFDAQGWSNHRLPRLYIFERAVDPGFFASPFIGADPFMSSAPLRSVTSVWFSVRRFVTSGGHPWKRHWYDLGAFDTSTVIQVAGVDGKTRKLCERHGRDQRLHWQESGVGHTRQYDDGVGVATSRVSRSVQPAARCENGGDDVQRRTLLKTVASVLLTGSPAGAAVARQAPAKRRTAVAIDGDRFLINGRPTYEGRRWRGTRIEGLLMNSRMVQGIFDDLNPETRGLWAYPDTGQWDAERNTREFIAAMPEWRRHGMLGFTINVQGGSPRGYSREQPWHNDGFHANGTPRPEYFGRLERILDRADELGMVPIVGYFYFGQDERLENDEAVRRAVRETTTWLLQKGYRNILVEIANECDNRAYQQPLIQASRVHELMELAKSITVDGRRLPVSVSYNGGTIPRPNVVAVADYLLLHGNGVHEPARIAQMVEETRKVSGYRTVPILFNEDDHFDFDRPVNNLVSAVSQYASWGYFDYRMEGEGFDEGFQSVPVNWGISSARKRGFFSLVKEMSGANG
jgi:hypothetical protein